MSQRKGGGGGGSAVGLLEEERRREASRQGGGRGGGEGGDNNANPTECNSAGRFRGGRERRAGGSDALWTFPCLISAAVLRVSGGVCSCRWGRQMGSAGG